MKNSTLEASSFEDAFFSTEKTYVHPSSIIGKDVVLGDGVKIGPYCVITGKVTIASGTRLHAHVTIGFPAEVTGMKESFGSVEIGSNGEIREFATIHASRYPDGKTRIGDDCYLMNYTHVSHDAYLGNKVTLINNANLGGHTHLEDNVIIMANAATHQFCRVGRFTALAAYSATRQDLPPFSIFAGLPASFARLNLIGLRRAGFDSSSCEALRIVTRLFYQQKQTLEQIATLASQEAWGSNPFVQEFLTFISTSKRGVSRRLYSQNNHETESLPL